MPRKKGSRSKANKPTDWQAVGNEVMDGAQNVGGAVLRNATFRPGSATRNAAGAVGGAFQRMAASAGERRERLQERPQIKGRQSHTEPTPSGDSSGSPDGRSAVARFHDRLWDAGHPAVNRR